MRDNQEKKVRRIAAVVYIVVMTVIVGGSYLTQAQKNMSTVNDPPRFLKTEGSKATLSDH